MKAVLLGSKGEDPLTRSHVDQPERVKRSRKTNLSNGFYLSIKSSFKKLKLITSSIFGNGKDMIQNQRKKKSNYIVELRPFFVEYY